MQEYFNLNILIKSHSRFTYF